MTSLGSRQSIYISFGKYLKMSFKMGIKPYNKDVMRFKCIMYGYHLVNSKSFIVTFLLLCLLDATLKFHSLLPDSCSNKPT